MTIEQLRKMLARSSLKDAIVEISPCASNHILNVHWANGSRYNASVDAFETLLRSCTATAQALTKRRTRG